MAGFRAASFKARLATFMGGLAIVLASVLTAATLIAGLTGDLRAVFRASLGATRPSFATLFEDATTLREATVLVLRVSLPLVCFKDIIPSDSRESFSCC